MARWLGVVLAVILAGGMVDVAVAGGAPKSVKLDVDAIFKNLDTNHDGYLSKDEFLKLANRFKDKMKARDKLTLAYQKIDTSHMGVSQDQFRQYLEAVRKKVNEKQ